MITQKEAKLIYRVFKKEDGKPLTEKEWVLFKNGMSKFRCDD